MELFAFDDDYVRRLRGGDRWTEEHFLSYFQQLLLIKLRKRLRSMSDVEDIRQEVFRRVFNAFREGKGPEDARKLGAWVNGICNHILLERYRSEDRPPDEPIEDHPSLRAEDDVDRDFVTKETAAHVRAVVDRLGERDAAVLRAIFIEERDKDEVCRELGVDREYLRVLLHRAKEHFRSAYRAAAPLKFRPRETNGPKPTLRK